MTAPLSQERPFRPLNRRVVAWVLLYSTLFTLLMTAVLIGIHYLDERDKAMEQLKFAAASYRDNLANSLWELDMPAVRLQVDALANFPMVGHAVLQTRIGQTIQAGNATTYPSSSTGNRLSWKETLRSPQHPERIIGQLALYADQQAFLHGIAMSALQILLAEAIKGLALALLLAWLIAKLVTRHVSHMARQVASLQLPALGQPLTLRRATLPQRDELDQLCDAFNHLHQHVATYITTQHMLETELRQHRDNLSEKVAERTHSLERLKEFHGLIIRVLTRFINLPPTEANAAVDYGLAAFGEYFGADRCLLLTRNETVRGFSIVNAWPPLDATRVVDVAQLGEDLLMHDLTGKRSRIWKSAAEGAGDERLRTWLASSAYTIVGVEVQGDTIGLLCLVGCTVASDSDNAGLLELATRVAVNMLDHKAAQANLLETQRALRQANRELLQLSRHDPLTGLANRRHFDEVKDLEFRRAVRADLPLSVLMCDIDRFKHYNDTYGHMQGDDCLKMLAACMTQLFGRAGELPVRLGGEEFAILLPDTTNDQAFKLAERLRQAVIDMDLPHTASNVAMQVTVSIGVASLKHGAHENFDAMLQEADNALYRAKSERNRTVMAE